MVWGIRRTREGWMSMGVIGKLRGGWRRIVAGGVVVGGRNKEKVGGRTENGLR